MRYAATALLELDPDVGEVILDADLLQALAPRGCTTKGKSGGVLLTQSVQIKAGKSFELVGALPKALASKVTQVEGEKPKAKPKG